MGRKDIVLLMGLVLLPCLLSGREGPSSSFRLLPYPDGKIYALSILDDADNGRLDLIKPVYDFLRGINVRVTKNVWMFSTEAEVSGGEEVFTLQSPKLKDFVLSLAREGHEIAFHGATAGESDFIPTNT